MAPLQVMNSDADRATARSAEEAAKSKDATGAQQATLYVLPGRVHVLIVSHLDAKDAAALGLACRKFWAFQYPSRPIPSKRALSITDLPNEIRSMISGQLGPTASTCLGLTCKKLWMCHKAEYGNVKLFAGNRFEPGSAYDGYGFLADHLKEWLTKLGCKKRSGLWVKSKYGA